MTSLKNQICLTTIRFLAVANNSSDTNVYRYILIKRTWMKQLNKLMPTFCILNIILLLSFFCILGVGPLHLDFPFTQWLCVQIVCTYSVCFEATVIVLANQKKMKQTWVRANGSKSKILPSTYSHWLVINVLVNFFESSQNFISLCGRCVRLLLDFWSRIMALKVATLKKSYHLKLI